MIRLRSRAVRPYVMANDPAIDTKSEAFSWDKFKETGDLAHLPVREGEKLTVFQVRPLSRKVLQYVMGLPKNEQGVAAVRFGLVSVAGLYDDERREDVVLTVEPSPDLGDRLTTESLDRICAFLDLTVDLSQHLLTLSTVSTDPT